MSSRYFIVTGVLALAVLVMPMLAILGAMVLVVPGIILGLMPALFLYSAMVGLTANALGFAGRVRWLAAIALVAGLTFAIPAALNRPVERAAEALRSDDFAAGGPVTSAEGIALIERDEPAVGRARERMCSQLCQRLLFNGAAQRVLVAELAGDDIASTRATHAFAIERRDLCPPAPIRANAGQWSGDKSDYRDTPEDRVKTRVASGECLVRVPADMRDAGMLLIDRNVKKAAGTNYKNPWSIGLDTLSARRIELLARDGDDWKLLDRKTQTQWEPLIAPLLIGPVTGYGFEVTSGFIRRTVKSNMYEYPLTDEYRRLFGDAVRIPAALSGDGATSGDELLRLRQAVTRALDSPSEARQAEVEAFEPYLKLLERTKQFHPEDAQIVARAVRDARVMLFFQLPALVRVLGDRAAPLTGAIMDRLESTPLPRGRDVIQYMSSALAALPEGAAAEIAPRLEALSREIERRGVAWRAIARMGDAGPQAALRYAEILRETPPTRRRGNHDDSDVIVGALMGLCRMGEQGKRAADALVERLAEDIGRRKGQIGPHGLLAVEALARMGEAGQLAPRFAEAKDWPRIERRIADVSRPRANRCVY